MLIVVIGRRATVIEEDVYQDTVGAGYMNNIPKVARNIVIAFFVGYLAGAVLLFFKMRSVDDFSLPEAVWQSLFLSVSALNNAGFSILPNAARRQQCRHAGRPAPPDGDYHADDCPGCVGLAYGR